MSIIVDMPASKPFKNKAKLTEEIFSIAAEYELWLVAWTFAQTYTIYAKGHDRILSRWGLTTSQWLTLWLLFLSDRALTVTEISRVMPIEAHSVGALLDRLCKRGMITRRRSRNDRRTVIVSLAEPGYKVIKNFAPDEREFLEGVVGPLSKSDRASLKRISKRVRNNVLTRMSLSPKRADLILGQLTDRISDYQAEKKK